MTKEILFLMQLDVAVDKFGYIYVYEIGPDPDRVTVLNPDGTFNTNFTRDAAGTSTDYYPQGMCSNKWGLLWLVNYGAPSPPPEGDMFELYNGVTASSTMLHNFGTGGVGDSQFEKPSDCAYDETESFPYVVDGDLNKIVKFKLNYEDEKEELITVGDPAAPPTVSGVTLSDPSPTKAGEVTFTIAFSKTMDTTGAADPLVKFITADAFEYTYLR